MYALDAETGQKHWSYETDAEIISSPAVVSDTVYIGSYDGQMYALNTSDGSVRWTFETDGQIGATPAVVDNTVYFGSTDSTLYALDAATGTERWSRELESMESSPTVLDGVVYVTSGYDLAATLGGCWGLDAESGEVLFGWKTVTIPGAAAVVNGAMYVASNTPSGGGYSTVSMLVEE